MKIIIFLFLFVSISTAQNALQIPMPLPASSTGKFLKDDGTFAMPDTANIYLSKTNANANFVLTTDPRLSGGTTETLFKIDASGYLVPNSSGTSTYFQIDSYGYLVPKQQ